MVDGNLREHVVQCEIGEVCYGLDASELVQVARVDTVRESEVGAETLVFNRVVEQEVAAAAELMHGQTVGQQRPILRFVRC